MARTVNKVILIGRLGADPDVRYSASGTAVVRFNMATDERVQNAQGEWEDRPEWHRIVVFGKTAENCGNYLSKGKLIYLEGRLQTRQWDDPQGVKRWTTEIVARDVVFLSSPGEQMPQSQGQGGYQPGGRSGARTERSTEKPLQDELPPPPGIPEEDIPF